jgi:putative aminopeptidase FrvX
MDREATFRLVTELVARPAPSGVEHALDAYLEERLGARGLQADGAGNRLLRIAGRGEAPATALAAHKDEIGAIVKRVFDDGRVRLAAVGDSFPWVWGEGPVDLLGDAATVPAVVSFGSRHVSAESAQRAAVDGGGIAWRDAWAETKHTPDELAAAGVRPGTRAVLPAARRVPTRLGPDGAFVAAPNLDDRLACAVLVLLADRLERPAGDVELVFTTREETGAMGARYYGRRTDVDRLVAVEVAPTADEYGLQCGPEPVLIESDARSTLDHELGRELAAAARAEGLEPRHVVLDRYGSDASNVYADGGVGRAACIAMSTDNTHGYEIAHLDGVANVTRTLARWLA